MIDLLDNRATVQAKTTENHGGRVTTTWTDIGVICCRFTLPAASLIVVTDGVNKTSVDAVVFALPDFAMLISGFGLPIRLVTSDCGWNGIYEMTRNHRAYNASESDVHHLELDVVKVIE